MYCCRSRCPAEMTPFRHNDRCGGRGAEAIRNGCAAQLIRSSLATPSSLAVLDYTTGFKAAVDTAAAALRCGHSDIPTTGCHYVLG